MYLKLLKKVIHDDYMGLIGHGGMVVFGTWFTQGYSYSIIKLVAKMTRHGANMGDIDGEN